MSALLRFSQAISPPPFFNPVDYDGPEWRWRFFVFRPQMLAKELRYELYVLLGIIIFIAYILRGKSANARLANKWYDAHMPLLSEQFSNPTNNGLTSDGHTDFFNFSTGRRGVASLHVVFALRPRHDLLLTLFQFLWQYVYDIEDEPKDKIELDFKLSDDITVPDFVFAIVRKDELKRIRNERWDLTLTSAKENAQVPPSVSIMSEHGDLNDNLLNIPSVKAILQAISDPTILRYFRSLSITDQPRERPIRVSEGREKHVILSLIAPSSSRAADTLPLVEPVFQLIDWLPKIILRPETKMKLKKVRDEFEARLKEELSKEDKDEAEEQRREKKKQMEKEKVSRLSAAEQKKVLDRERKRANKKLQSKVVRK